MGSSNKSGAITQVTLFFSQGKNQGKEFSTEALSHRFGLASSTTRDALRSLRKKGWIVTEKVDVGVTYWTVNPPAKT